MVNLFTALCLLVLTVRIPRLVARHVGASLNVWTSVIGIVLGGICLGNVLGGRKSIASNAFGTAGNPMFDAKPGCMLFKQGSFITGTAINVDGGRSPVV